LIAMHAGFGRLKPDRQDCRSRRPHKAERDVMPHQFEAWVIQELRDNRLCAGEEIIDA
jgi:hypothetical protein